MGDGVSFIPDFFRERWRRGESYRSTIKTGCYLRSACFSKKGADSSNIFSEREGKLLRKGNLAGQKRLGGTLLLIFSWEVGHQIISWLVREEAGGKGCGRRKAYKLNSRRRQPGRGFG